MTRSDAIKLARAVKASRQPSLSDRFWSKVSIRGPDECWLWIAGVRRQDEGYGAFWLNGRHQPASRIAWKLANGGQSLCSLLVTCHTCDNPSCCNPAHLFVGSHIDNNNDKVRKQRHARGSGNGTSKRSDDDVRIIKSLAPPRGVYANRGLRGRLAEQFNVRPGTIFDVWRRSWNHI